MIRPADSISAAALTYLALPAFVFLAGWAQPMLGIPLGILLAVVLVRQVWLFPIPSTGHSGAAFGLLAVAAVVWSAFGGAGHLMYSNVDWLTRDAVYADLFVSAWPPSYGFQDGAPLVLRTAMGFFLPPAAATKLLGTTWAAYLLLAWSALGCFLFLALLPLPQDFGPRLVILTLVVVFFSGMDYLGINLVHGHAPIYPLPLEWWLPWTYSSLTAQMFWAPNHALALWIATALFYRHCQWSQLPTLSVFLVPILLLWTPFVLIGLLPWFIRSIWRMKQSLSEITRGIPLLVWTVAIALSVLVAAWLASPGISGTYSNPPAAGTATGSSKAFDPGLAFHYVQFLAFEFLLLVLAIIFAERKLPEHLAFATTILVLLPIIRFGPSNDLILRASTPSLIILMIIVIGILDKASDSTQFPTRALPLIVVLFLGAITPVFEFMRAATWSRTSPNYSISLVEQQGGHHPPHYIGRFDQPALRWLFRDPKPVPRMAERQL